MFILFVTGSKSNDWPWLVITSWDMYPPSMKQPSGWFSILKFKASWSFANFEMGVSLHSLGFPWIPIRHLQTPEGSHRDDRLDARNCWWCSGDPPRKCAKAMVFQRKLSRTGGGYISFHTYVQLPEIWYPWLASLDALPHFCAIFNDVFGRQQARNVKPWRRLGYPKTCNWQNKIWWS